MIKKILIPLLIVAGLTVLIPAIRFLNSEYTNIDEHVICPVWLDNENIAYLKVTVYSDQDLTKLFKKSHYSNIEIIKRNIDTNKETLIRKMKLKHVPAGIGLDHFDIGLKAIENGKIFLFANYKYRLAHTLIGSNKGTVCYVINAANGRVIKRWHIGSKVKDIYAPDVILLDWDEIGNRYLYTFPYSRALHLYDAKQKERIAVFKGRDLGYTEFCFHSGIFAENKIISIGQKFNDIDRNVAVIHYDMGIIFNENLKIMEMMGEPYTENGEIVWQTMDHIAGIAYTPTKDVIIFGYDLNEKGLKDEEYLGPKFAFGRIFVKNQGQWDGKYPFLFAQPCFSPDGTKVAATLSMKEIKILSFDKLMDGGYLTNKELGIKNAYSDGL